MLNILRVCFFKEKYQYLISYFYEIVKIFWCSKDAPILIYVVSVTFGNCRLHSPSIFLIFNYLKMPEDSVKGNNSNQDRFMDSILSDPVESFAISLVLEYLQKKGWNRALEGLQKDLKQVRISLIFNESKIK